MNCFMTWLTDESVLVLFVAWKQVKLNKSLTQANMIEFSVTIKTKTIGWKRSCMVITKNKFFRYIHLQLKYFDGTKMGHKS